MKLLSNTFENRIAGYGRKEQHDGKKINMPKLAPEMESGVLCAWLKEEGDTVAAGEPLFEIETNKVVNQVEATVSGVLKKQLAEEGDTVRVDTAVAVVEAE